jgi:hypothetical protein
MQFAKPLVSMYGFSSANFVGSTTMANRSDWGVTAGLSFGFRRLHMLDCEALPSSTPPRRFHCHRLQGDFPGPYTHFNPRLRSWSMVHVVNTNRTTHHGSSTCSFHTRVNRRRPRVDDCRLQALRRVILGYSPDRSCPCRPRYDTHWLSLRGLLSFGAFSSYTQECHLFETSVTFNPTA